MSEIQRNAKLCGKKNCILGTVTIDTGSPINVMNKNTAKILGCKSIGKKGSFMTINGEKITGDIVKCDIHLQDTCCKNETEVLVVGNNFINLIKDKEILLGKEYTEKTGMDIDEKKTEEHKISCECGKLVSRLLSKQNGVK